MVVDDSNVGSDEGSGSADAVSSCDVGAAVSSTSSPFCNSVDADEGSGSACGSKSVSVTLVTEDRFSGISSKNGNPLQAAVSERGRQPTPA